MLLEAGADVNAQGGYYGNNALQTASRLGRDAVVQRFLKAGADVNAQGGKLGTALKAASRNGHNIVVQRLLEAGANITVLSDSEQARVARLSKQKLSK